MDLNSPKSEPEKSYEKRNTEKVEKDEIVSKPDDTLKKSKTDYKDKKIEGASQKPKDKPKNKIETRKIDIQKEPKHKIQHQKSNHLTPPRNKIERPTLDLSREPKNKISLPKLKSKDMQNSDTNAHEIDNAPSIQNIKNDTLKPNPIVLYFNNNKKFTKNEIRKMDPLLQRIYRISKQNPLQLDKEKITPIQYIDNIPHISISYRTSYSKSELHEKNIPVQSKAGDIAASIINFEELETLLQDENIFRIEANTLDFPLLEVSTSDSTKTGIEGTVYIGNNADASQSAGYEGTGVVAAVIDPYGIRFTHEDFQKDNGDTRVYYIWDQSTGSGGSNHPAGYTYGTEYDSVSINNGTCYQTPGYHGNTCIGIMAGDGSASPANKDYAAMAPNADIIYVKGSYSASSTYMQDGVEYIMNKASTLGKPAVVNISLGNQYGPHDGTSLKVEAIDNLCGAGKIVVFACGNSGSQRIHAETTISQDGFHSFEIDVVNDDFGIDLWFSGNDTLSVYLDSPNLAEVGPISYDST